jgi:hypothetical protein
MEQVASVFRGGIFDYSGIKGDTGNTLYRIHRAVSRSLIFSCWSVGWLVYPAGHVWIYGIMSWLLGWQHTIYTTEYEPKSMIGYEQRIVRPSSIIVIIQLIFLAIYIAVLAMLTLIYIKAINPTHSGSGSSHQSHHHQNVSGGSGHWIVYLLLLSRRMQSIFVLGFFNDCIAVAIFYCCVIACMYNRWTIACLLFR